MNMENFKKYLVNVQKSFTGVFVTIYVLCALCIGVGVIKCLPTYSDYDSNKEGFAKTKILCVDEPFAELVGDKYKDMQLQLAIGEDNNMYIVGLNPKNDFPVVSKNMTDEELASYKPVEIKGKSETLPDEAKSYLLDTYGLTSENVDTILGSCYLVSLHLCSKVLSINAKRQFAKKLICLKQTDSYRLYTMIFRPDHRLYPSPCDY